MRHNNLFYLLRLTSIATLLIVSLTIFQDQHPVQAAPIACDHTIGLDVKNADGLGNYGSVRPGDIVCITAGTRGALSLINFQGTTDQPITFINFGGKVTIDANGNWIAMEAKNSEHIRLTGTGDPNVEYGFELSNATNSGLFLWVMTRFFEVDHIEMYNTGAGIRAHTLNDQAPADWVQYGTNIHHTFIHDLIWEGMYIGKGIEGQNGTPLDGVEIHHNRVERTGWEAIQVRSALNNVAVYNNYVHTAGIGAERGQSAGINIQADTVGDWYNNIVINASIGIQIWRTNNVRLYNNTVIASQTQGIFSDLAENIQIYNNLIAQSGKDHLLAKGDVTTFNNLTLGTIAEAKFTHPEINDYHLQVVSPAVNTGSNSEFPPIDFEGIARPQGISSDIGAFEYVNTTPAVTPTVEPTPAPVDLAFDGPASINSGETFSLDVVAQDVPTPGLYGIQLEINYDPTLISVNNLQPNPNLSFVVLNSADNTAGKIRLVASQQGKVSGLTGNVTLLSFEATAANTAGTVIFTFENEKMSDSHAQGFDIVSKNHSVSIGQTVTPEPTDEPTPEPTNTPTPTPTNTPPPEPTDEPTPEPTDEPTPEPTGEPTPEPTDEPTMADVSGHVILAGRAGNDWSGAVVTIDDNGQFGITEMNGNFSIADVAAKSTLNSITADAPGYLPAVCTDPTVTVPETVLTAVNLLSGDINDDNLVDITDATAVGSGFGQKGADLPADITRDGVLDIFDIVLVSVNFGEAGPKTWSCLDQ